MSHTPLIKTSRQGTYSKYRGTVALDDPSNLTLTLIEMRMHKKDCNQSPSRINFTSCLTLITDSHSYLSWSIWTPVRLIWVNLGIELVETLWFRVTDLFSFLQKNDANRVIYASLPYTYGCYLLLKSTWQEVIIQFSTYQDRRALYVILSVRCNYFWFLLEVWYEKYDNNCENRHRFLNIRCKWYI